MDTIAGFQKTGRVALGPGSDLVELNSDKGFRHTAIVFHPEYRDHPAIGPALEVVKGFLEAPYVTGLLELVAHDPKQGAFVYPTGQVWSAYEVVRTLADLGQVAGVRAGLELMFSAGEILVEAAAAGEQQGVYSHGGLTPWRVLLKADGQVEIMGYAVPQVEILQFQANPNEIPGEDAFRYCPPERMESTREELSADLFGLALIAFELITGKPVYDGLVNDIRTQASRGEGSRRLFRFKDQLPNATRELLNTCMKPAPQDRFPNGAAYLKAVQKALSSGEASGPSLLDVMGQVSRTQRRQGEELEAGKTQALSKADLKRLLDDEDGDPRKDAGRADPKAAKPEGKAAAWTPPANRGPRAPIRDGARAPDAAPEPPKPAEAPKAEPARPAAPDAVAALSSSGDNRWGRPDPGRRVRQARTTRHGEEAPEDLGPPAPEPVKEPEPVKAAEPPRSTKPNIDDLIRSISTSSDNARRTPASRAPSSAAAVIDAILSDSAGRKGGDAAPPVSPTLTPDMLTQSTADAAMGLRRAPRRLRPEGMGLEDVLRQVDPAAQAEAARQEAARQEAARQEAARQEAARQEAARLEAEKAQLARLEAARQELARIEAEHAEAARVEAARQEALRQEAARQEAARQEAARQEAARQEAARQEAARQEAARQEALRQEAALEEAIRQETARAEAARQEALRQDAARSVAQPSFNEENTAPRIDAVRRPPTEEIPLASVMAEPEPAPGSPRTMALWSSPSNIDLQQVRPPDPVRAGAGGQGVAYRILRGPGGTALRTRLPGSATLAEAVSFLMGTLVPVRSDLQGRITLSYRLGLEAGPSPGDTPVSSFVEGSTLVLHPVVARDRWLTFRVEADGDPVIFKLPVSTAIAVSSVTDHLCGWLRLPADNWTLNQADRALSPHLLMDEVDPEKPLVLRR